MDEQEAVEVLRRALERVAPTADLDACADDDDLAFVFRLDSIDILELVTAVRELTGIDIPERDLPSIRSRRCFSGYLTSRLAAAS